MRSHWCTSRLSKRQRQDQFRIDTHSTPGLAEHSSTSFHLETRDSMASRRLSQQMHGAVAHARSYDAGCQTACYHKSRHVSICQEQGGHTFCRPPCRSQNFIRYFMSYTEGKNRRIRSLNSCSVMGRGSQVSSFRRYLQTLPLPQSHSTTLMYCNVLLALQLQAQTAVTAGCRSHTQNMQDDVADRWPCRGIGI
jgi:hypothetical protein